MPYTPYGEAPRLLYTSQNEYVKAPNLCICLPKPIDTYSKNVLSCSHRNKVL